MKPHSIICPVCPILFLGLNMYKRIDIFDCFKIQPLESARNKYNCKFYKMYNNGEMTNSL